MKHIFIFLSLNILLSQELEVEGNLKVTGTVESATIDSLQQVIANMQAQIDVMQSDNRLGTRVYEVNIDTLSMNGGGYYLSLPDLLGFEGRYLINPHIFIPQDCPDYVYFGCEGNGSVVVGFNEIGTEPSSHLACSEQGSHSGLGNGPILTINGEVDCWDGNVVLWITAQFPD